VINRYDPLNLEIAEEHITKALTRPAEWKIPNDYAAVRRMQSTATSLMEDDSEISRAIRQMAKAVCRQRFRKRNSGSAFR
jgi:Flp pilus assembly CpaE family ATPase